MFPQFYQNHLEKQLKPAQYHTLKSLVYILQSHKQVSIELLASFWPYPIQFESRRRSKHKISAIRLPQNRKSVVSAC